MVSPVQGRSPVETRPHERTVVANPQLETAGDAQCTTPLSNKATTETRAQAAHKAASCQIAQQLQGVVNAKLKPPEAPVELLKAGHAASEEVYRTGLDLTNLAAEGIAGATQLARTGRVVTSGTVSKNGRGQFSYSPTPRDKLVVPHPDGGSVAFKFEQLDGDLRSTEAFFGGRHKMKFSAEVKDKLDLAITSERTGRHRTATAKGQIKVGGTSYDADLTFKGVDCTRQEGQGSDGIRAYEISGSVNTKDSKMTIDERYAAQEASADVRDGLRVGGHAISSQRTINNTLEVGGSTYVWRDVQTKRSFRNGKPSSLDSYWSADGSITKDGKPFGKYRLNVDPKSADVVIEAPNQTIRLESYSRR